jgi:hypothetical protein
MLVKINVKTPKNQAKACVESQKDALVGVIKRRDIKEQKVISHDEFYWILECKDRDDLEKVIKKCAKGETMIKKFYSVLFKIIHRANVLASKFKKGISWAKKWIMKKLDKVSKNNQTMKAHIDSMTDEQFRDWLTITDREAMDKLLAGNLINIKVIKE